MKVLQMLGFGCMGASEAEAYRGIVGAMRALQGPGGLGKGQEVFGSQGKVREPRIEKLVSQEWVISCRHRGKDL